MKMPLKAWRALAGLTQLQLAEAIGYATKAPISRWEQGKAVPQKAVLEAVARAVGCEPDDIILPGRSTKT